MADPTVDPPVPVTQQVIAFALVLCAALAVLVLSTSLSEAKDNRSIKRHASVSANIRRFEAALGMSPGQRRVVPQLGASVEYLRTVELPGGIYVVYIKKLD